MTEIGVQSVPAADAESALERLEEADPDVIITDIRLPGMSGVEFTQRVKSSERFANVPVILISAFEPPNLGLCGADAFIRKPFDIDALAECVSQKINHNT